MRSVDTGKRYCCFPDRWNAGGSLSEIQVYIDQSKSTLIDVRLSSPELAGLVGLTLRMNDSHSLGQAVKHQDYPIPTLHVLRIITDGPRLHTLEFPSVLQNPSFYTRRSWRSRESQRWLGTKPSPRHRGHHTHECIHFEANGLPLEYIGTISGAREGLHHIRCRSVH